jgi:hypothetical protein
MLEWPASYLLLWKNGPLSHQTGQVLPVGVPTMTWIMVIAYVEWVVRETLWS